MSAPRPYETDPFHPPSSVPTLSYDQFLYIYKTVPVISSVWYLHCVLEHCTFVVYACAFPEPLIFQVILFSMWYILLRDTAKYRHRH